MPALGPKVIYASEFAPGQPQPGKREISDTGVAVIEIVISQALLAVTLRRLIAASGSCPRAHGIQNDLVAGLSQEEMVWQFYSRIRHLQT